MPDKLKGHHILLYAGDFARLQNIYHKVSPNFVIRELVRRHLEATEAKYKEMQNVEREHTADTRQIS